MLVEQRHVGFALGCFSFPVSVTGSVLLLEVHKSAELFYCDPRSHQTMLQGKKSKYNRFFRELIINSLSETNFSG